MITHHMMNVLLPRIHYLVVNNDATSNIHFLFADKSKYVCNRGAIARDVVLAAWELQNLTEDYPDYEELKELLKDCWEELGFDRESLF